MTHRTINRLVAAAVLVVTFGVYLRTLAPTVVFWDVGEFIAAAKLLQIPHPPGSPLFLLVVHIAMMIPFAADQAVRAHLVSAASSALTVMFLYLVVVRVILNCRKLPETLGDRLALYGAAAVGALSLAFSTSFWDNAIEAEVYGASMLFVSFIMWLALRWMERAGAHGNEKFLLLIAYLIGLSLGVHLLALLAIFPVLMIVFFRTNEMTAKAAARFVLLTLAVFWVVYPGIVKYLPGMMDGDFAGQRGPVIDLLPWLIVVSLGYGAYRGYRSGRKVLHLACVAILLIILGYTTYTSVLIRSNTDPPMNENTPNTLSRLTSYLGREQYGNSPTFSPRRWGHDGNQQRMYTDYSSDWDFLFRYQLEHMFFRYVGWNFAGVAGDAQDSGVGWKETFGIPLLLALFGAYAHFRRDWKMALVFLAMFVVMGPVLALYQNQQEPQPRERDYFYVGAYYVVALWIGIGAFALIERLRTAFSSDTARKTGAIVLTAALIGAVPANMLRMNWFQHDRSGNYTAWDLSYNILQSCDPNAILFTNADNDTFPVWYLQDVEGIRRDVRVVNLSLANLPLYIKEMKDPAYYQEAEAVPMTLTDDEIATLGPARWDPQVVSLAVPPDVIERYNVKDSTVRSTGKISFLLRNTLQFGRTRGIRVQDIVVHDILQANAWRRPIYFAATCPVDARIGLDNYLWFQGLAWELKPLRGPENGQSVDADILETNLLNEPEGFSRTPRRGYKFRNVENPEMYLDETSRRMVASYRSAFFALASHRADVEHDTAKALAAIDRMQRIIPQSKYPMNLQGLAFLASLYHRIGADDRYNELASLIEPMALSQISADASVRNFSSNPYAVLLDLYAVKKEHGKSVALLERLQEKLPGDPEVRRRLGEERELLRQQTNAQR